MASIREVVEAAESLWPVSLAEDWDRPGIQIGNIEWSVERVLLAVDLTAEVVSEAVSIGANLIVTHHPFLIRGVSSIDSRSEKGAVIIECISRSIAVFSAHTNADSASGGVSDVLARAFGLTDVSPLVGKRVDGNVEGIGRLGLLEVPVSLGAFAALVAVSLPHTAAGVLVSGAPDRRIEAVALCGGAGDSLIDLEPVASADVFVTSDLRHHVALDARERANMGQGPALINVSHWASESLWLDQARVDLASRVTNIEFIISTVRTDPWDFCVESGESTK